MSKSVALAMDIIARDKASKTFDAVGNSSERTGKKVGAFAKKAVASFALVGTGALVGGKAVFNLAANMELMDNKAKTVFGDQTKGVQKWAKANANAMGLTSREATGLAANFADLLIPMGFTRQSAAKMSTSVVGLSGALSRWSNGTKSAAEVSAILAKAMLGERDGLKELGISISDADVKNRLLKNGKDKLIGAALEQAKAEATQQLIMEKSTDAQAAYANGSQTLAARKAVLTARVKELRDKGIAYLIPKLIEAGDWINKHVVPAVKLFAEQMRNGEGAGGKFAGALKSMWEAGQQVAAIVVPTVKFFVDHPNAFKAVAIGAGALAVALKAQAIHGAIVARFMPGLAVSTAAQGRAAGIAAGQNAANAAALKGMGGLAFGAAGLGMVPNKRNMLDDPRLSPEQKKIYERVLKEKLSTKQANLLLQQLANIEKYGPSKPSKGKPMVGGGVPRAGGGPVTRGKPYIVGEVEPELFVPETSGRILNQRQMRSAGGGDTYLTFNLPPSGDPLQHARQIETELTRLRRQRGTALAFT